MRRCVISGCGGVLALTTGGCGLASMIETNTKAIHETTSAMKDAAGRVEEANRTLASMQSSLDETARLREPMQALVGMSRPMAELAEMKPSMEMLGQSVSGAMTLRKPMQDLAEMEPTLLRIEGLRRPMEDMTEMKPALEGVTALKPSLNDVAALDASMKSVAALREPMERVAALRTAMEDASKLGPPIAELAQIGRAASLDGSKIALLLAGWGLVTFLGVYGGVVLGIRQTRPGRARAAAAHRTSRASTERLESATSTPHPG